MRTFKDDALSFLSQVFLFRGGAYLSVGVIVGFTLEEKPELLPEPDCMAAIKDGLGKDILFDACMPKPLGEILVAGKCFAPGGKPVTAVIPAIRVGPVVKRLAVFGNRRWNMIGEMKTAISEPESFTEMEISWKRAFGGPEYELNPEGMGLAGEPLPLPNVEIPGHLIAAPGDRPPPAGFGPMGMGWPGRLKGLGTFDDAWKKLAWPAYPDDFNFLYFNRAPADQRIEGWFRGDEPVETDHLHPERTYIRSRLPGVRVRGFAARREKGTEYFVEMDMRLETVWLLPNALTGFLIWRGVTPSADDEASNIPFVAAFTEPLDTIPESLEHYLARVRSMEAGEGAFAVAEAPAAKEAGVEAAGIPGVPGLPGVQIPGVPGAGRVAAAGIAGVAGVAVPAMAEEKAGPQETGLPGAVPEVPGAAPEIPAEEGPEAAGAVAPPPAEGLQKPLIVHSAEEIPKVEIPEFPPLEELAGQTAFEKKTEDMLREALAIPPDEPLFQEPPPLPDMTPEALQAHMESLAAQAEAEARRFFGERGLIRTLPWNTRRRTPNWQN